MRAKQSTPTTVWGPRARALPLLALLILAALGLSACGDASGTEKTKGDIAAARDAISLDSDAGATATTASGKGKTAHPQVIGFGQRVEVTDYVVQGQYTVVDFTSEYCGPCRQLAPWLEKLHKTRGDVTVVKVDINREGVRGIDWSSPVVKQYGIRSVPHLKVYDTSGKLTAEGKAATDMVVKWLEEMG